MALHHYGDRWVVVVGRMAWDTRDWCLSRRENRPNVPGQWWTAELMQIGTDDLKLDDAPPWVWVRGRKKGDGTDGVAQPLTQAGADALRALAAAGGLGKFSSSSMRKSFVRACAKQGVAATPYQLRHQFATDVLESTGSVGTLQLLMRHRDAKTSLIYAKKAVAPLAAAAVTALNGTATFAHTPSPAPTTDEVGGKVGGKELGVNGGSKGRLGARRESSARRARGAVSAKTPANR